MNVASKRALSRCSKLIERYFFSPQSPAAAECAHAALIKIGLHRHTFLCNRLINLYSNSGAVDSCSKVFRDLGEKNIYTWNILLAAFSKIGDVESARHLFDEMPEKDVVSVNSMISGYAAVGLEEEAIAVLGEMEELRLRPSGFTLSIAASSVSSVIHAKQIHGCAIRHGVDGNVIIGNAIIHMYGKLGVLDYAIAVFSSMGDRDIISWNELILALERSGFIIHAMEFFRLMLRNGGIIPDGFTLSIMMSICGDERDMGLGEQIFVLCIKLGHLSNSIVASCIIDMYSLCDGMDYSIRFFMELVEWDSHTINSMASCYARSGYPEEAQRLVMMAMRDGINPTNITIIIMLNTIATIHLLDQAHSLVLKSGHEMDPVIANSILKLYSELGDIRSAVKIFSLVKIKDLICWNSMITGFAEHGYGYEALRVFKEMTEMGNVQADRITLKGVLKACALSGLVEQGALILSSMEEFGVMPETEHFGSMVDLCSRARMVKEAMEFVDMMQHKIDLGCIILLEGRKMEGDVGCMEEAAQRAVDLQACSPLPYTVLARIHGEKRQWESMARVLRSMKERGVKKDVECSSIAIRSNVFIFRSDQVLHFGGESLYSMLRLLEIEGKHLT